MRSRWLSRLLVFAMVGASFGPLAGCGAPIYVQTPPPPPPRVVQRPPRVDPRQVWLPGYYRWDGHRHSYGWNRGRWVRPRRGQRYLPSRWVRTRRGWIRRRGHWEHR